MARPKKVKQPEPEVSELKANAEVDPSENEFDTEIVNEAVQEKAPEKVTKREFPKQENKAVHRVLEQKKVNAVPGALYDQIPVLYKGAKRTWTSETLKVMQRADAKNIQVLVDGFDSETSKGCCG